MCTTTIPPSLVIDQLSPNQHEVLLRLSNFPTAQLWCLWWCIASSNTHSNCLSDCCICSERRSSLLPATGLLRCLLNEHVLFLCTHSINCFNLQSHIAQLLIEPIYGSNWGNIRSLWLLSIYSNSLSFLFADTAHWEWKWPKRDFIFSVYIVTCFLTLHGVQTQPFLNTVSCASPQTPNRAFKAVALISILIITCFFITASAQLSLSFLVSGPHHQNRLISEVFWHWHIGGRLIWTLTFTSIFYFYSTFQLTAPLYHPFTLCDKAVFGPEAASYQKRFVFIHRNLLISIEESWGEWEDCLEVVWSCCPITDGRMSLHCSIITSDH